LAYRDILICLVIAGNLSAYGQQQIAFLSDTQEPMWVEKLALKSNNNREATAIVFGDIVKTKPALLLILGDVVNLGYKEKKWSRMDSYLDSSRRAGITVHGLLGNHDVMTASARGEAQFQRRFPDHNRLGYYRVMDSTAIVLLNSNFKKLTKTEILAQEQWLQTILSAFDSDPAIAVVILTCHHAPYSNSRIVGSSEAVQRSFVPAYLQSKKARLFITGHSHNFERFTIRGKDFVVIGGGGGLSQPLSTKSDRLTDANPEYKPAFHYLLMKRKPGVLHLTSRLVKEDFSGCQDGLTFSVSY
jgi:predicted phosphodiesterase